MKTKNGGTGKKLGKITFFSKTKGGTAMAAPRRVDWATKK
jgi:hypothetical protein